LAGEITNDGERLVKRAATDEILAATLQLDAGGLDQALQADFFLQPLDFRLWDARQDASSETFSVATSAHMSCHHPQVMATEAAMSG
jgi:hypothetical protein